VECRRRYEAPEWERQVIDVAVNQVELTCPLGDLCELDDVRAQRVPRVRVQPGRFRRSWIGIPSAILSGSAAQWLRRSNISPSPCSPDYDTSILISFGLTSSVFWSGMDRQPWVPILGLVRCQDEFEGQSFGPLRLGDPNAREVPKKALVLCEPATSGWSVRTGRDTVRVSPPDSPTATPPGSDSSFSGPSSTSRSVAISTSRSLVSPSGS
jgi:hypothetical protein